MYRAIKRRQIGDVLRLIKQGADVNDHVGCGGITPLALAAQTGYVGMAALLIRKGARVNNDAADEQKQPQQRGISYSVRSRAATAENLMDAPNEPIIEAIIAKKYRMCVFLVKKGANLNFCSYMKMQRPATATLVDGSSSSIRSGSGSGSGGDMVMMIKYITPLFAAIYRGLDEWLIEKMLQRGANPNHQLSFTNPVRYSATIGRIATCRLLISYGADIQELKDFHDTLNYNADKSDISDPLQRSRVSCLIGEFTGGDSVKVASM